MPTTPTPADQPLWKTVGQRPDFGLSPTGQYVQGYTITGQIVATGSTFTVFVPDGTYTTANVMAALAAKAEQVAGVDGLTG